MNDRIIATLEGGHRQPRIFAMGSWPAFNARIHDMGTGNMRFIEDSCRFQRIGNPVAG